MPTYCALRHHVFVILSRNLDQLGLFSNKNAKKLCPKYFCGMPVSKIPCPITYSRLFTKAKEHCRNFVMTQPILEGLLLNSGIVKSLKRLH